MDPVNHGPMKHSSRRKLAHGMGEFKPSQVRAQAEVWPEAEGQVCRIVRATGIEYIGVLEHRRIAISRANENKYAVTFSDLDTTNRG